MDVLCIEIVVKVWHKHFFNLSTQSCLHMHNCKETEFFRIDTKHAHFFGITLSFSHNEQESTKSSKLEVQIFYF